MLTMNKTGHGIASAFGWVLVATLKEAYAAVLRIADGSVGVPPQPSTNGYALPRYLPRTLLRTPIKTGHGRVLKQMRAQPRVRKAW